MATLILKGPSANRASGEWNDDDCDTIAHSALVGAL
jgi:hypothetical protein